MELEDHPFDWIAERANVLTKLAATFDEVNSEEAKDMLRRMGNKVIDSIIMPPKAEPVRLVVDNDAPTIADDEGDNDYKNRPDPA